MPCPHPRRTQAASTVLAFACVTALSGWWGEWNTAGRGASAHAAQPDSPQPIGEVVAAPDGEGGFTLSLPGESPFWRTDRLVQEVRLLELEAVEGGSEEHPTIVVLWEEVTEGDTLLPHRALGRARLEGEEGTEDHVFPIVGETSYTVRLRYGEFEPLGRYGSAEQEPFPEGMEADEDCHVFIVQFWTQPLEQYRAGVREAGGTIYNFLADHSYLVRFDDLMDVEAARASPYVRWVGAYHPGYRVEPPVLQALFRDGAGVKDPVRYHVQVLEEGLAQLQAVASVVTDSGGEPGELIPEGSFLEAVLTAEQLATVLRRNETLYVDRWFQCVPMMDVARDISGATYLAQAPRNFRGQGVRGEVWDQRIIEWHPAFRPDEFPPGVLIHGARSNLPSTHGTLCFGTIFGEYADEWGTSGVISDRGMDGQGIYADGNLVTNDYQHMSELVTPGGPYQAVFQSRSFCAPSTDYNNDSTLMDHLVFLRDILVCVAQGNHGGSPPPQLGCAEAWSKNVISVGGPYHHNTLTRTDDTWNSTSSSRATAGPATDGRIKPDLTHFYDYVRTTSFSTHLECLPPCMAEGCQPYCLTFVIDTPIYPTLFGGTSAATPITAGYAGLFFQMWHEQVFPGFGGGSSVFASRPHAATAKAMLINSAYQYPFNGLPPADPPGPPDNATLYRMRQGWGMVDIQNLYSLRQRCFIIDESEVLPSAGSFKAYAANVTLADNPPLRATLVYTDPHGTTSSTLHRINDLSLRVTSPSGTVYWGNGGLSTGRWSTSGGGADTRNTVENVFVQSPEVGAWKIEVVATELNRDGHAETPTLDADFALVVSGAQGPLPVRTPDWNGDGRVDHHDVADFLSSFQNDDADIDGDGVTGTLDFFAFVSGYFLARDDADGR